MFDAGRRPMGRLFYWAIVVLIAASGSGNAASGAAPAGTPATTQVVDTVLLADECLNASTWAKSEVSTTPAP